MEVCLGGRWGTVCADEWDYTDSHVVCKQFGLDTGGKLYCNLFSSYINNIIMHCPHLDALVMRNTSLLPPLSNVMETVSCSGNEISLTNCSHNRSVGACPSEGVAGVQCFGRFTLISSGL